MSFIKPKIDLYQKITDKIVVELESGGVSPWMRPWDGAHLTDRVTLPHRHSGEPYRGVNVILLWMAGIANGYRHATWMTYKQADALGGQVRGGEKGEMVVYADRFTKTETDSKGEEVERHIPFLKAYTVFNITQIDHLPARFYEIPERKLMALPERLVAVDAFVHNTGAVVNEGGNRAYYAPGPDRIQMPPLEAFRNREAYYSTLAHELTHWTGHKDRLARDTSFDRTDPKYAIEEIRAEMGAAFLCAALGITAEPLPEHTQYINSWTKAAAWLTAIKADSRLICRAAADAQRSTDWLFARQSGQNPARPDAPDVKRKGSIPEPPIPA